MLAEQLFEQLAEFEEIIFDLDNTLYQQKDFDRGAFEDITAALKKESQLTLDGMEDFLMTHKKFKGNKYNKLFNDTLDKYHLSQSLLPIMLTNYFSHNGRYINKESGLMPLIKKHLVNNRIFVVTNGPIMVQETKVRRLALEEYATIVICSSKEPQQLKPNSYAFDELSKKNYFIKPVMVGDDHSTDGLFATNVNIPFIHFDITQDDK
ncbi:MAG: putative hydrolase of the HAD superfamily [Francisellaceae bacterium]|jgi:putative hydrolase of the HAD superfamily|uniref:HAD family hydrolase n=1 Tax=unclassified Colwellia TaxID=196834 RepID=UPI0015F485CA|nr:MULTISPECIES: HAD hydrolase-like protein [unclassified Colwellia]MBA6253843.1 HAD hydrolase-like protein [Colwellia sp. MB3u-55]MBA6396446.1 HAD hydrolase-like protein [Colwellia sp. BRX10-4]